MKKNIAYRAQTYVRQLKTAFSFLRHRGWTFTYNYFWLHSLYREDALLRKIFLKWLFPYTVPYPPFIEVEVTTKCHLKCRMCEHTYWSEPQVNMTFAQFKHILDQFPKLKWIGLTGIGESFMNPDFMKIISYVKSKGIYIELFDTFLFFNETNIRELIRLGLDRLVLSMDGATKETYEKLRIGSNFNKVVENIKAFVRLKSELNAHFPQLDVYFIVTKENVHEVPQYVDLAHEIGIDGIIRFTALLHPFEEIKGIAIDIPEEIVEEAEKRAKKYKMAVAWNKNVPPMNERRPLADCTDWIMPFIFVTGHVIPCCATNEANRREFQKFHSFGNIFQTPFKEIWHSKNYVGFRKAVHDGITPPQCVGCTGYNTCFEKNGKSCSY